MKSSMFKIAGCLLFGFILGVVTVLYINKGNQSEKPIIDIEQMQYEAERNALAYTQIYNTMYTKESYDSSLEKMKNICSVNYYNEMFAEPNHTGMPDTMGDYKMEVLNKATQYSSSDESYISVITGTEYLDKEPFDFTMILKLDKELKITYSEKRQKLL